MPDYVALAARDWGVSLCRGLEDMWRHSVVCDTVIYANDGQTFNAHAAVLMASSPYLKSLLWAVKKQVFSVEMDSISSDTWTAVLNFMYSGKSNVDRKQLETVLEAAEKLEIPELSQQCLQQLNNQPLATGTSTTVEEDADTVQNLSMKENVETPTDLSVKPATPQTSSVSVITQPSVLNMPGHWIPPPQIRPMQWPFPFPPNMLPPGQLMTAPFITGNPGQPPPPLVSITRPPHPPPPHSSPSPVSVAQPGLAPPPTPESPDNDMSKRHKCSYCGKRFKLRHVLQQHELTHTNIKPYYCDICGFRARQKAVIWKHKKLKHGKEEHVPIRVSMDDGMRDLSVLEEDAAAMERELASSPMDHTEMPLTPSKVMSIAPENLQVSPPPYGQVSIPSSPSTYGNSSRQYICNICHKSFRNKHVLAQHMLIHSKFRPYACDYCDFRAKQKAVIWRHIKVKHADMKEVSYRTESPPRSPNGTIIEPQEDPIKQEEDSPEKQSIGRRMNNVIDKLKTLTSRRKKSYDLKSDVFLAGGNQAPPTLVPLQHPSPVTLTGYSMFRRFQCKTCHKVFKNKHILLQHELVHSNLRPYKCQFCGFRAKQKAVMWRHLRSRHPEKGRVRIVEDIDLCQIRESSAAEFSKESNMRAMDTNLQSRFDEASENQDIKEDVKEAVENGAKDEEEEEIEEDLDELDSDDDDMNEGDAFFCQTCGKGFNEKDVMEQHQKRHIKPLTCDQCGFRTRSSENLERHIASKHTVKPESVKSEPRPNFVPNPALLPHQPFAQENHVPSLPQDLRPSMTDDGKHKLFLCNRCPFSTRHQTSLSRHKKLKHDNILRSDDLHSQGSPIDAADLEEDANKAVPQPSSSAEPGSPAVPPSHLMSFCLQQNPVSFPIFPNPTVMPIQMHLQNQQHQQQIQQQIQQQQQQQQQQALNQTNGGGEGDKKYSCHVCGRGFKHRHVLHQHKLVHTNLKPYACEFCDFRGRQKASLWRHRQKHLQAMGKTYIPPNKDLFGPDEIYADSGSPFAGRQDDELSQGPMFPGSQADEDSMNDEPDDVGLLAEEYADDGEEEQASEGEDMEAYAEQVGTGDEKQEAYVVPTADGQYACSVCGHVLASKMSCQRHCHTHRTGKCYKCQECSYQTPYSFALQRHIRIHTGERPYTCDICKKTFKQSGSLLWHKRKHHNEEVDIPDDLECDETMDPESND